LGLILPKHQKSFSSLFQRIDCMDEADWEALRQALSKGQEPSAGWRAPAHAARELIAYRFLARKALRRA
jgi:hypothetical protein